MSTFSLKGLIAAPYSPFHADLSLNLATVPKIAAHLVRQKVRGVFINGTTGEWASLTDEERKRLAVAWREAAGPELKLIVHVGHNSLAASQELSRHAEEIGADAIGALMPCFFRPATMAVTVDYCRRLAAAAPRTPFYYYHIPDMTGVNFNMAEMLPLLIKAVPTFRGVKFTHSNLVDYSLTFAAAEGKHDILFGRDEAFLAGLTFGAEGAVGSTYNYSAALYHKLMALHAAGRREEARAQMVYIQKTIMPLLRFGGLATGKAVMALAGVDCGPTRPPIEPLAGQAHATVKAELESLDFFNAIAPAALAPA